MAFQVLVFTYLRRITDRLIIKVITTENTTILATITISPIKENPVDATNRRITATKVFLFYDELSPTC